MTREYDSEHDEQSEEFLQVDVYGIKTRFTPAAPDRPPDSWREVWRRVHKALMTIVSDSVMLIADVLSGSRSVVKGLASLPAALSDRISGAHKTIEDRERNAEKQIPILNLKQSEVLEEIQAVIGRLNAKGLSVQVQELTKGQIAVYLTPTEQAQLAVELAEFAIKNSLDASLLPDTTPEHLKKM
jgi:hypothetical protein